MKTLKILRINHTLVRTIRVITPILLLLLVVVVVVVVVFSFLIIFMQGN